MGKVILVASGKGGTGKTTATAAISSFLARRGAKTLCIDCDVGLRNLDLALGLTDVAITDFSDVISGSLALEDAVISHPKIENLSFLAAPSGADPADFGEGEMRALTERIKETYDYCLMDAPAGIGPGFRLAAAGADMAIVVATGDASSLRDGQRTVIELTRLGVGDIRLLVNRVAPRLFRRTRATLDDVIDSVGARLIGIVSEDKDVSVSANLETPLMLFGARYAYPQFDSIARRIVGEDIPIGKIPTRV